MGKDTKVIVAIKEGAVIEVLHQAWWLINFF